MFSTPWSDFGDEWDEWRELAERYGIPGVPKGTRWDSWDEDPSQRSLIVRAMRETPDTLRWAISGSSTWYEVVKRVLGEWREMERDINDGPAPDLTPSQSTRRIRDILDIIKDS